jgi:integrase
VATGPGAPKRQNSWQSCLIMTTIRIPKVKSYESNNQTYYYLRKTGERIIDPATRKPIDPRRQLAEFVTRVEAMMASLEALPKSFKSKPGTLQSLVEEYRGRSDRPGKSGKAPSPEWMALAPATRRSYDRILDPETGYLRRAIKLPLDQIALHSIDKPNVVRFRNKVAKQFGFWTGNYTVKVLRPLFEWGILYGHMKANPATGVPALERPDGTPVQHRSWAPHEFEVMLAGARERGWDGIVLALALARFAGWPLGDIVHQPPITWQHPRLVYVRRKTRKTAKITNLLAPDGLRRILEEIDPDMEAETLVTNEQGERYTEDGLRTMVHRLATELAAEKKVKPGLNIHGLRHSLGKELYDLGLEREARKAIMAHESDAASKVYERDGDRSRQADKAVRALNRKHLKVTNEGT